MKHWALATPGRPDMTVKLYVIAPNVEVAQLTVKRINRILGATPGTPQRQEA